MKIGIFQKGFNYSQDGQGNRLVYHLQGCNMKCPWCSNPEGMSPSGTLFVQPDWLVDSVCPHGAVSGKKLNRSKCEGCDQRECLSVHRNKGIYLSCVQRDTEQMVEEILSASPMFYDGGGVTFTGGEPTLQAKGLTEILAEVKEKGIHTAIETNGSYPGLPEMFPLIDQLIMDCKQTDPDKHKAATGISNGRILENLKLAAGKHPRVHIRVPMIGGVNDSEEDVQNFIGFFRKLAGPNVTFEILTYHEYGKNKWEQCGLRYQMWDAHISDRRSEEARQAFREAGLNYQAT
ncbi:glycyl-radical enzyme activating protein [Diplocloster agilis]|uniref:glycyl-radical enzyme activating protein n=1 Tax=Diplocloster agilis TaxID=2850323 RepID=UPI001EE95679|nr:glycyl-radical enzyme activating protein [Diplocloster agilis]